MNIGNRVRFGNRVAPIPIQRQQLSNNPTTLTNERTINMRSTFRKMHKVMTLFAVLSLLSTASLSAHADTPQAVGSNSPTSTSKDQGEGPPQAKEGGVPLAIESEGK